MFFRVLVVEVEVGDMLTVRAMPFVGEKVPDEAQPERVKVVIRRCSRQASEQSVLAEVASVAYVSILHWCASTGDPHRTEGNEVV